MNFRLILVLCIGLLLFTSIILFGFIFYQTYDSNDTGKVSFGKWKSLYFGNVAILILAVLIDGVLFIKA